MKNTVTMFTLLTAFLCRAGAYISNDSTAKQPVVEAMQMALDGLRTDLLHGSIHHSDRGLQYCCPAYVRLLETHGIKLSMGDVGNPYDNAIAERANGILKTEFFLSATFASEEQAAQSVAEAVTLYNDIRPHLSIGCLTPSVKYAA